MCGQAAFPEFFQALAPPTRLLSKGCCPQPETGINPGFTHTLWITNGLLEIYTQPCAEPSDGTSEPAKTPFPKKQCSDWRRGFGFRVVLLLPLTVLFKSSRSSRGQVFLWTNRFSCAESSTCVARNRVQRALLLARPNGDNSRMCHGFVDNYMLLKKLYTALCKKCPAGASERSALTVVHPDLVHRETGLACLSGPAKQNRMPCPDRAARSPPRSAPALA